MEIVLPGKETTAREAWIIPCGIIITVKNCIYRIIFIELYYRIISFCVYNTGIFVIIIPVFMC